MSMAISRCSTPIHSFTFIFFFIVFGLMTFHSSVISGQLISTACTSSLISSFTPCFNFLTGSTNGGGSPTGDCCTSLASLISTSTQCACLILTGNVPISLPFINKTLAVSLPRICGSRSVPLQCSTAVGAPLPGPGPVSYAPSLPPLPTQPPLPDVNVASPPPSLPPPVIVSPPSPKNQRPLVFPNSDVKISIMHSLSIVLIFIVPLNYLI